ncbi:hypothetical protein CYLTODRAFT_420561 [Cylindrobasidium torrendii FP15055 ss-10]|uniref:Uncharacterized protein n=1 Tax=Cylindrobasidium torrendii FP15055 ss-10 TaxID=1314674 RepID=A0A0D7BGK7_9AGAR|nr:hypothetical protein CYLTODRAFT_420561 [Cylindrobasidium torrendii FP15055 ss-10]
MDTPSRAAVGKIAVDTPADLERIKQNFVKVTMEVLEKELTRSKVDDRDALVANAMAWADQTFDLLRANVRINGASEDDREQEEESEPFDEGLDRSIWSLADSRLGWQKKLGELRREVPSEVAARIAKVQGRDEGLVENDVEMHEDVLPGEGDKVLEEQREIVEEAMRSVVAMRTDLVQTIPLQRSRAEKLEDVSESVYKSMKS